MLILGLSACSNVIKPSFNEAEVDTSVTAPSDYKGTLHIFEWSAYDDQLFWDSGDDAFHNSYPYVSVEFNFITDGVDAINQLKSHKTVDLVHSCYDNIENYYDDDLIEPINVSLIPNWKFIDESIVQNVDINISTNKVYFIPVDWGYYSFTYREDLLDKIGIPENDRNTYDLLFNPKLKGKIMIIDSASEFYTIASIAAGIPKENLWRLSDSELNILKNKLQEQKSLINSYWIESYDAISPMASGEIAVVYDWGEIYITLKNMGINVSFARSREGSSLWVCGFSIPKGLKERDFEMYLAVHAYINAWLSEEAGRHLIDDFFYGHSNRLSINLAEVNSDMFNNTKVFKNPILVKYSNRMDAITEIWDEIKN